MSVIKNLFKIIQTYPLQEKILIAKNHAQGLQWKEWVSRDLGPVSNVTVQTIEEFIFDYGKLALSKSKKKLLNSSDSYWLVYSLMSEAVQQQDFHFEANVLSPGFVDAFYRAIMDLRHAGVTANFLKYDHFEQEEKGQFIKLLLHSYENYLTDHQLVDLPGLHPYLSTIQQQSSSPFPVVIIQEHVHLSHMETEMLNKITDGHYETLQGDSAFFNTESSFPAVQTEFFHSTGILSELKEVLRRMAGSELPLDQVEWIASDYDGYVSAAIALSAHFELPISFSKGLPLQFSTIGKAAYNYLKWVESNFHIDHMIQAFKDYQIQLKKEEKEHISNAKIVTRLERLGIGWGQERYVIIEKAILTEVKEENKQALEWVANFFKDLFEHFPNQGGYSPKGVLDGLTYFLETYCSPKGKEEALILLSIQDIQKQMGAFNQAPTDLEQALDYVKRQLEGVRFQVTPVPEPGKIHISSIQDGGYSGRPNTFILGMDSQNWSLTTRQDPILLDEERLRISGHLKISSKQTNEKMEERQSRLATIKGNCTLSFCSSSPIDKEGKHPAYEMLQVYRKKYSAPNSDMSSLLKHLGEPIYFSGKSSQIRSSETEIWLQSIMTVQKEVKDGREQILEHYKALASGENAISSRKGHDVTAYDGFLQNGFAKEDFDSLSFSATHLERFAECSLRFYFEKILGIRPKEKKELDRTSWLTPLERGSLMHEIFYRYMTNRIGSGNITEPHDRELLQKLTEHTIEEYKEQIPVPSHHVAQKEITEIYQDMEVFITQEEKRSTTPKYLELQIHPDDGYLEVELSENVKIPLRGFVDRVDELEPHVYRIYDYKTGKAKKFEDAKYFGKGRQLQHALYALAVEQWLRKNGHDSEAVVKESVYYFPTQKGLGKEVIRKQNQRDLLAEIIEKMMNAIQKGTFLPTSDPNDCIYCDFKEVCGDHAKWRKEKMMDEQFESILGVSQYE
jgi:ATP-dependent helicase/nuclease subunit B